MRSLVVVPYFARFPRCPSEVEFGVGEGYTEEYFLGRVYERGEVINMELF